MLSKAICFFISLIIFLHCVGLTQFASACAKDKAAFICMLNMNEEETKKEKDVKEDTESNKFEKHKYLSATTFITTNFIQYFKNSDSAIKPQFLTENPTPPPDTSA